MAKLTTTDKAKIALFEKKLRKLYRALKDDDGVSDMSFRDFRAEFISLGDPHKMRTELVRMQEQKDAARTVARLDLN